jgi:hypothetical protein
MELYIIIILSVLLILSIFININLFRKNESHETYADELEASNTRYEEFYQYLQRRIDESYSKIKQIDRIGSFEADDETGWIFKTIKDIVKQLNEFFK